MRDSLDHAAPDRHTLVRGAALACCLALALWLAVFAIYGGSLHYPFVFDDLDAIVDNETLRAPSLWAAWLPPSDTPVSGRPLVNLSFALNARVAGPNMNPFGFRLVNLTLHALNAWLVFALLRRLLSRPVVPERVRARAAGSALAIALLWACHPLQSEAVLYVTQRSELMVSSCVLLALSCALRYLENPAAQGARSWLLLAAVSCGLGSACKEIVIAVPVLTLALDRGFYSPSLAAAARTHRALYLGLCVGLLPLALQLQALPRDRTAGFALGITPWQTLAVSGHAIAWYLRLSFWPAPLSVTYNWSFAGGWAKYWRGDLLAAGLLVVCAGLFRSRAWIAAAGVWFFALLAPSTSVLPIISEVAAERRMYLPLLAVVSAGVVAASARLPQARMLLLGCLLLTAAESARSHTRAAEFASAEALFRAALRADPDNPQALWGLAQALAADDRFEPALALYERMAAKPYPYAGPASWGTRGLMAASMIYQRRGDVARARATLQRALAHDPNSAISRLQRAATLVSSGQDRQAIRLLNEMLEQPFLLERIHRELATLYARTGDLSLARQHVRAADAQRR